MSLTLAESLRNVCTTTVPMTQCNRNTCVVTHDAGEQEASVGALLAAVHAVVAECTDALYNI